MVIEPPRWPGVASEPPRWPGVVSEPQAEDCCPFKIWSPPDLSSKLSLRGVMLLADIETTSPGFNM